uniref:protein-serine/threonine phosphatase n=1 Tax=Anthurium amnicola TaxID=1678845 RepID=A0A1D1XDM1_9ARAE
MSAPGGEGNTRQRHHGPHRHHHQQCGSHRQQQQQQQHYHHRRRGRGDGDLVPLAALISRELKSEKMERPKVRYGCAAQSKKGEDYFLMKEECQRVPGSTSSTFSVFAIFDGHNGNAAAVYAKENLLNHILSAIPRGLGREEWLQALPRALVAGFVKTDKEFQSRGETSGTTATFVIVDRWTVTVASVGDSRCILDTQDGAVTLLTVDHRLEENAEERERVTASGGEVGRLSILGGTEVGPLRCWPGGLCLSRSIGDMDVGEFIVPVPYVKQVKLSNAGGRLIIASDGIWDALLSEAAAKCCRGLPAELAAKEVVKEALRTRGLKDDTTCIVVDIMPPDHPAPPPSPPKKQSKLKSFFFRKRSNDAVSKLTKRLSVVNIVEEIFEEGSAMLSERLGNETSTSQATSGLFTCAICQVDLAPSEGFSVHAGAIFSTSSKPWQGPFLCATCRDKKDAMEGKRPSGVKVA